MPVDPRDFTRLNVADTCAVWNILSSRLLASRASDAGCHFCCTAFVIYECLHKQRKSQNAGETELIARLKRAQARGHFASHHLDIDDLNDIEVLQQRKRLGKGELASIAFARRTGQAFITDDQGARKLAASVLAPSAVQTTPHLFGWLLYGGWLSDSDKDDVIAEHRSHGRPLASILEEVYMTVMQYRSQSHREPSEV